MENNDALFKAYEETKIEIFQTKDHLDNLGWNEYFVITAWNPFSRQLSLSENCGRNISLERDLLEIGGLLFKAIGRSNDWKWVEESFAVRGVSQDSIILMAKKYEQNAIFKISGSSKKIISCVD